MWDNVNVLNAVKLYTYNENFMYLLQLKQILKVPCEVFCRTMLSTVSGNVFLVGRGEIGNTNDQERVNY